MTLRKANEDDKMRVLNMARAFHAAAELPFAFSAAHADALFNASVADDDRLCLVLETPEGVRGVLAAQAAPHPFGPFKVATELIWWIEPECRGLNATNMLKAYEAWATDRGCQYMHMVGLGSDPVTSKLYERRGYTATERHFMKPISA